jgi:toxin ParE1/3/4
MHYRIRPDYGKDAPMAIVGRYVILFRIIENTVRIERIVYGGRDLPALFLQ